jgi:2,4-dienoyl-CoA reductase-like NADH-dependent reductase (Old Yellow Enzyme family)
VSEPIKLSRLRTPEQLAARLRELDVALPFEAALESGPSAPLAAGLTVAGHRVGNRFAVLPMEGWDGTADGRPTDLVRRRWERFGESGAKLIWGGEAVAVRPDGRANPNQLVISAASAAALGELRAALVASHEGHHGSSQDLLVGLQLTHSGRFARPEGAPAPRIAYRHPVLDARVGVDSDGAVLSDAELDDLVGAFVEAAVLAREAGFAFVDVKACHGYLGHELLSATGRQGPYGGDLAGRSRFHRRVIAGIRRDAPELAIGMRLSIFDVAPFTKGPDGIGVPEGAELHGGFGADGPGTGPDLAEPDALLGLLTEAGVSLLCTTAGSPYYNPHVQRPAFYPPSDGYEPPEDPLVGVARQLAATAALKRRHPGLVTVGSGYSYLQEWLPNVAQAAIREGATDLVGIGRMALSYPTLPSDVLAGEPLQRRAICRTFSDCTTAPRGGLVSGCYPIDPFYKRRPEAAALAELKRGMRR